MRKYGRHINITNKMDALLNSSKLAAEDEEQRPKTPETFINVKKTGMPILFVTSLSPIEKLMDITAIHGRYRHKSIWVNLLICQMETI